MDMDTDLDEDTKDLDSDSQLSDGRPLSERNGKEIKQDPKVCGVCGDKALGNNFNAITCESCKAFFRRNALRTKSFACPFNDNCKVDPVTRRFCQKCRLKKCFDIGMKKEWIMTEEEKKMKKQKIEQNRLKRTSSETAPISNEMSSAPAVKIPAFGQDLPSKEGSPEVISYNQNQSLKQPMMPHNENSIPFTELNCGNVGNNPTFSVVPVPLGRVNSRPSTPMQQQQQQQLQDHSRISTVIHSHSMDLEIDGNKKPEISYNPSLQTEQNINNNNSRYQHLKVSSTPEIWSENCENNTNSGQYQNSSKSINQLYYNDHVIGTQSSPTLSSPESRNESESYLLTSGEREEQETSPQMPLLASLIRPGLSESPPEIPTHDSSANSYPESPEDESKFNLIPFSSLGIPPRLSQYQSNKGPYSPEQSPIPLPRLTAQFPMRRYPGEDEDNSLNHSSSSYLPEDSIPLPLNTMDSILKVAISAEFNGFGVLGHVRNSNSKELNKSEKAKLNELSYASQALNAPVDQDGPINVDTLDPSLINVINLTDIAIRRLIKMSKKISAFKNMCQEDQIALLKGGCAEMMILRSVVSYDPERDSWNIPHSKGYNLKLGVLKEARGNLYEVHQRFVKSFKPDWRSDNNIMIILCAITLFTPERPCVIHKDVVKLEQDSYYYLLKRYLESTRNGCDARSTYLQLIQKIAELHVLNSNHLRVFLEVNPKEVEPLLIEIFDLKQ